MTVPDLRLRPASHQDRGLLQARAAARAQVQAHLSGIHRGKKSRPSQGSSRNAVEPITMKATMKASPWCSPAASMLVIAVADRGKTPLETALEARQRAGSRRTWCGSCLCSQYMASVGTSVRDSMYEASMANTTASARGTNRKRDTPVSRNIGTNTTQMHSVETSAGSAIWCAPSRIAGSTSLPCSRCQLMFSIATVASSTRMPTASARPPSVMILMVSPIADRQMIEVSTDSGIEIVMISVLRQRTQEQQDHETGQRGRDHALADHAADRGAHEDAIDRRSP